MERVLRLPSGLSEELRGTYLVHVRQERWHPQQLRESLRHQHGAQFAIGGLPARGLESSCLQRGAVLQHTGVRSTAGLQLAFALPFDDQRSEYQSADMAGCEQPTQQNKPETKPQTTPVPKRQEQKQQAHQVERADRQPERRRTDVP